MSDVRRLVARRGRTHGPFEVGALVSQRIKAVVREGLGGRELAAHQAEALDLIATKVGRIVAGDACFPDHWDDVGGYAMLGRGA